jgi:hypothetical protein
MGGKKATGHDSATPTRQGNRNVFRIVVQQVTIPTHGWMCGPAVVSQLRKAAGIG